MHTQNLLVDPRSSLLVTPPDVSGDPLGASRVTILGTSTQVTAEEVRELYLSRHENAKFWQDYSDFAFCRLEVSGVYFIGGFGVMGWVSADDYTNAKPDPLAEAAIGIIEDMNSDHAEALRQIAGHYTGEAVDEAMMTAVDRLGFHLRLKSGDRVYGRRVAFIRQVASRDDARSVLVEMVRHARTS
jgi:putative heme iron utilization protein